MCVCVCGGGGGHKLEQAVYGAAQTIHEHCVYLVATHTPYKLEYRATVSDQTPYKLEYRATVSGSDTIQAGVQGYC